MPAARIVVANDSQVNANVLYGALERLGYEVPAIASSGEEAVRAAATDRPDLVLMDMVMSGEGIGAAERIHHDLHIPVVYLMNHADEKVLEKAKLSEALGFIAPPYDENDLYSNVEIALYKQRADSRRADAGARENWSDAVEPVRRFMRLRDPKLHEQQERVAALARAMGERMQLPRDLIEGIGLAASLHGVGLMGIPADIRLAQRDLASAEERIYRQYPRIGQEVLENIGCPWPIDRMVLQHRELHDGSGFPAGLRGEEIMPEARIIGMAYELVSMTANPARGGLSLAEALHRIGAGRNTRYDAAASDACIRVFMETGFSF